MKKQCDFHRDPVRGQNEQDRGKSPLALSDTGDPFQRSPNQLQSENATAARRGNYNPLLNLRILVVDGRPARPIGFDLSSATRNTSWLVRPFANEPPRRPKFLDDVATIQPSKCNWRIERFIAIGSSSTVRLPTRGPDCTFHCQMCPTTALLC